MSNGRRNSAGCEAVGADHGAADEPAAAESYVLTIDVVAGMFKMSSLALRILELRGLVRRRRSGNSWVYSWFDCERIALIVKARKAGLTVRHIALVLKAMEEQAPNPVAANGRLQCLALIHDLESRQKACGNVLAELYRIDWELSERLGVKNSDSAGVSGERT